jgi:hypothetical protein
MLERNNVSKLQAALILMQQRASFMTEQEQRTVGSRDADSVVRVARVSRFASAPPSSLWHFSLLEVRAHTPCYILRRTYRVGTNSRAAMHVVSHLSTMHACLARRQPKVRASERTLLLCLLCCYSYALSGRADPHISSAPHGGVS